MPGLGMALGQRLGDGDGLAHHDPLGRAHRRDHPGRGVALQEARQLVGIEPRALAADRDAEPLEQESAAQGPARIGAVGDGECIGHRELLGGMCVRTLPGLARPGSFRFVEKTIDGDDREEMIRKKMCERSLFS